MSLLLLPSIGRLGARRLLLRTDVRWLTSTTSASARRTTPDAVTAARVEAFKKRVGYTQPPAQEPPPISHASEDVHIPSVLRPIAFLLGFATLSFGGAAYYSRRQTDQVVQQLHSSSGIFANLSSYFATDATATVSEQRCMAAHKHALAARLGGTMQTLVNACHRIGLPDSVTQSIGQGYLYVAEAYLQLGPGQQVVVPIVAVNALVFGIWAVSAPVAMGVSMRARLGRWMVTHFMHRPASTRVYTMLTSTFSHQGALHFGFNNFALWTIGGSALVYSAAAVSRDMRVVEASHTPEFLAFFATAGVFAATVSHVATALRFRRVAAVHGLGTAAQTVGRQRSLGASGAVYAALVMSACALPDARVSLILLPFFSLPIGVGVSGLVVLDALGVLLRWTTFDHWAHLGGALFGFLYFHYGAHTWNALKRRISHSVVHKVAGPI